MAHVERRRTSESHFSASVTENATSPRAGISSPLQIPKLNWVFHGFYEPFLPGASTAYILRALRLVNAAASQGYTFGSLHGERDEEYQFGVTIPYKGWSLDSDTFRTRANNFFDHNNLGESNVFIPVTLTEALIRGWELTLRSPRLWQRTQLHLAYSNQIAEFRGNITGGLIPANNTSIPNYIPLDHDQRNTSQCRSASQPSLENIRLGKRFLPTARASQMATAPRQWTRASVAPPWIICPRTRQSIFRLARILAKSFLFPRAD